MINGAAALPSAWSSRSCGGASLHMQSLQSLLHWHDVLHRLLVLMLLRWERGRLQRLRELQLR
jgi:hypothetical protein